MKIASYLLIAFLPLLSACTNQESQKKTIAIVTPLTHPSLEKMEKGFKETIESHSPGKYRFTTFNAQGNKTLMRGEIEEIASGGYSLVFTLGASTSQMVKEVFNKKGVDIPIVFTCVNDPIGLNLISDEKSAGNITGVEELLDFEKEIDSALIYKPEMKRVLLAFNPMEPGLIKDQRQIDAILKKKGMELMTVELFETNEFMTKLTPFMERADAVVVLKDNKVVAGLDLIIKLCNHYQIPLIASDLDSPDRGAAFGYGVHEIDFGIEGAKKALLILNQNKKPSDIAVTPLSNFIFTINREAALLQGIDPLRLEKSEAHP